MYKGTREFIKFIWPFLESVIIAMSIGVLENTLAATMIVLFIAIFVLSMIYGTIIKSIGWGICGFLLPSQINFFAVVLGIIFFAIRFFGVKLVKKIVS